MLPVLHTGWSISSRKKNELIFSKEFFVHLLISSLISFFLHFKHYNIFYTFFFLFYVSLG